MKKIFYFVTFLLSLTLLLGKPVSSNIAKQAAVNFLNQSNIKSVDINQLLDNQSLQLYDAKSGFYNDTLYYIFRNPSRGWIIMSGDDRIEPVIGYSVESHFDKNDLPPSFISWMSNVEESIENIIIKSDDSENNNNKYYNLIKNINAEELQSSKVPIKPFIITKWNQSYPYNALCPIHTQIGKRALTGCVATAMAQLINYHKFPLKGNGFKKYNLPDFGDIEVDLSKSEYKYDLMRNNTKDFNDNESVEAVAKLMLDCGVSTRMNYGVNSSGAYSSNAAYSLRFNFGYNCKYIKFDDTYTDTSWHELLYQNLANDLPMYYTGSSSNSAHAFVCDGYENGKFHFNWGWGGKSDGYFEVSFNNSSHDFGRKMEIIAYLLPKEPEMIPLKTDKFEPNNTESKTTKIQTNFQHNKLTFNHLLNIHDTSDVDFFELDLADDGNNYLLDLDFHHAGYNYIDSLKEPTKINLIVYRSDKIDTLRTSERIELPKDEKVLFKIAAEDKKVYGTYYLNFTVYRFQGQYIDLHVNNEYPYSYNSRIPIRLSTNIAPPYIFELENVSNQYDLYPKFEGVSGLDYFYTVVKSMQVGDSYRFLVYSKEYPNLISSSEFFTIAKNDFVTLNYLNKDSKNGFLIDWTSNFAAMVVIDLYQNSEFVSTIVTTGKSIGVINSGTYLWYPPSTIESGEDYQIRISKFKYPEVYSISDTFSIDKTTSVKFEEYKYPLMLITQNSETLTINLKNQFPDRLILLDILGRKVAEISNNSEQIFQWNLPNLPKGVYLIQEIKGNEVVTHKIIR